MNPQSFYGHKCPVGQTTLKDITMPAMSLRDSVYVHYRACDIELQDVEQNLLQWFAQPVFPTVDGHLNLLLIFIFHAHEEIRETTCGKTTEPMLVYFYGFEREVDCLTMRMTQIENHRRGLSVAVHHHEIGGNPV